MTLVWAFPKWRLNVKYLIWQVNTAMGFLGHDMRQGNEDHKDIAVSGCGQCSRNGSHCSSNQKEARVLMLEPLLFIDP